jgi:glycosyltransferase involved in cell wall biosynthesis
VDSEKFKPGKKTDYPSMVYFGGVRDYKRPEVSIYLAHELSVVFPQIRLFFIGEGTGIVRLKRLVSGLGIESNVQFMGRLDEDDLADTVSKSWINIHSSVTEGWGLSVVEASSAGTPTVAYDVPGISDSIQNGYNGLKVENGNIHDLLDAALQILVNPLQWWVSSREVALEYSWDETVRSWERLIHEVIGGNASSFPRNVKSTEGQH